MKCIFTVNGLPFSNGLCIAVDFACDQRSWPRPASNYKVAHRFLRQLATANCPRLSTTFYNAAVLSLALVAQEDNRRCVLMCLVIRVERVLEVQTRVLSFPSLPSDAGGEDEVASQDDVQNDRKELATQNQNLDSTCSHTL